MLRPLEVIWVFDALIEPPAQKMMVCVEPEQSFFFRINTKRWPNSVRLSKTLHPFLHHASHLECSGPQVFDDYTLEETIRRKGVIGIVSKTLIDKIIDAVDRNRQLRPDDKQAIARALRQI